MVYRFNETRTMVLFQQNPKNVGAGGGKVKGNSIHRRSVHWIIKFSQKGRF